MDGWINGTGEGNACVPWGPERTEKNMSTSGNVHHIKKIRPIPGQHEGDDWGNSTYPMPTSNQFCLFPQITDGHPGDLVGLHPQNKRQKSQKAT